MKVVIFAEKPSLGRVFVRHLIEQEPTVDRSSLVLAFANDIVHLNTAFSFPRGLPYRDFPMILEQDYKPFSFQWLKPFIGLQLIEQANGDATQQWCHRGSDEDIAKAVSNADRVYLVLDSNDSADYLAKRLETWILSIGGPEDVLRPRFFSIADNALRKGLREASRNGAAAPASSVIRKHFDFNYLLNANVILQATFQAALGRPMDRVLAKNALQILFYLADGREVDDGKLIEKMTKWRGTGRYGKVECGDSYEGMGRCSSRADIIQHLIKEGLLDRRVYQGRRIKPLHITVDGLRFLEFLHPDCRDADQVCRIAVWQQLPLDEAKSKIDRYIRTFFGKQKRFLAKRMIATSAI